MHWLNPWVESQVRADEFTKSMEAANARVLAFGASVGVLRSVTNSVQRY